MKLCRKKKSKKKANRTNPFDIGRCKFSKANKGCRRITHKAIVAKPRPISDKEIDQEAREIIQMAEDMSLFLKSSREKTIEAIKEQLNTSTI